ncbi:MAG: carboxypeptidase regulatory-like domain-containing protein [Woeseiaceae bacterium]|nr:carboxypeptidase regulatory-like domain-containing protein [Woeseiaceae bacterium]
MKDKSRLFGSTLATFRQLSVAALAALVMLAPVASNAQDTTSAIRGKVLDPAGSAVAGATVVVEDTRSGVERTYQTNASGTFLATRLLPGGPYSITVDGTKTVNIASIGLGDTYGLTISMQQEAAIEEIIAIGQAANFVEVASGPAATFNIDDIDSSVAFSRDIADVYEIDPRLMVDNDEDGFGLNCAGKHPRFNNVTLDGVSQTDRFGLNENGYATAVGMPFPFDAVETIAVELAPFDVNYGGFSACNINAVTKSGTNEFDAKVFYEFSNQDLRGDRVADDSRDYGRDSYDKTYIGFNVGGPIIRDKLFFFAAYSESETPRFLARGYAGSGNGEERDWLSQADYDRIVDIARNTYNYDPGDQPGDGLQEDEKYLVRLDYNINDDHNAAFIYNYYDGYQLRDSDGDDDEFEFSNHFYTKGAENEQFTFKLTSQWTDSFSTEIFYNTSEMKDSQVTVGPKDFADMQISIGGRDGTVYLGADDSRQANRLSTEATYLKLSAQFLMGDHVLSAGYDREELDIFNIFVQHSNGGEYDYFDDSVGNPAACDALTAQQRYDDSILPDEISPGVPNPAKIGCEMSGIDRFELGRPSRIYYGSGGGTNVPEDAAAVFGNTLNSLYIQDEIFIDNLDLTLTAGLRYEWFTSSDRPNYNDTFTQAVGIRNDSNIDGLDLLMPRFGFTWGAREDLEIRGGIGLYSGGNPNVWISNAWSNDGLTNAQQRLNNFGGGITVLPGSPDSVALSGQGRPGYDVPQSLVDDVLAVTAADANDSFLALIDPNYKQPREWKLALGGTWDMPIGDLELQFDYLHTQTKNAAYYVDVSQQQIGTTTAGSPIYDYIPGLSDNYMLTNSSREANSNVVSFVLKKEFDMGLDLLFGYAYTDAEDISPMTSSTAGSNFDNVALLDIQDPTPATSNYVVPQRFTMVADYRANWFADTETRITIRGYVNEGQPQSYAMNSGDLEGDGFFGRHLLYVPTGPNDPNVVFTPYDPVEDTGFDQAAFFQWVSDNGLSPGFQDRNAQHADWSSRFDLRISQEIPMPGDFLGRLYFKVYNFGNLLNDDWGKITDAVFFTPQVVDADVDSQGRFEFVSFSDRSIERTIINRSLWEARVGIDIKFGQ